MGKYIRKSKATGEVAVMDVSQSPLGVRTRAKTLALQRLTKSSQSGAASPALPNSGSYLQLRSRTLEKPPTLVATREPRRPKTAPKKSSIRNPNSSISPKPRPRLRVGSTDSVSVDSVSICCLKNQEVGSEKVGREDDIRKNDGNYDDGGIEASLGENVLEFEGRERGTRESTPCSLIRDPDTIRTPGSTTRPTGSNRRVQNSTQRPIPTAHEMEEFFSSAEEKQQRLFIEKYNFDPVNDKPLPGRYEWEKVES